MAAYRPRCPVLAVTRDLEVARHMQLYRGVVPVHFRETRLEDWTEDMDTRIYYALDIGWERHVGDSHCCLPLTAVAAAAAAVAVVVVGLGHTD